MPGFHLHHIGVAVKDLTGSSAEYMEKFGYDLLGPVVHDKIQTAYIQLLSLEKNGLLLELVAPDGPASKLANALKKGGGLNHICYACPDIAEALRILRAKKMLVVSPPQPSAAFTGCQVAWVMGLDGIPVELLQLAADEDIQAE